MADGESSVLLFKCRLVKDGICDEYHLSQDLKEVRNHADIWGRTLPGGVESVERRARWWGVSDLGGTWPSTWVRWDDTGEC